MTATNRPIYDLVSSLTPDPKIVLAATLYSTYPPRQRPAAPAPPAHRIDLLGELIHGKPSPLQLHLASAAVHSAASAYRRRDGASDGSGSAGALGEELPDYEGSGDETDSDQEMASPRSSAARVARIEAKALATTTELQSLLAQRDGVMRGAAADTARSGQGGSEVGRPEAETGTAKGSRDGGGCMDVAAEELQESSAPSKKSQLQSVARKQTPPLSPAKTPSASPQAPLPSPAASRPPVQGRMAAPEAANAVTGATAGFEGLAVAPPLPPSGSSQLSVPTPSHPQAPSLPMETIVLGSDPFCLAARGRSLQPSGVLPGSAPPLPPPPLPSSPRRPPPPPPPMPFSGTPRSAGPAGRKIGASDAEIEFIPLGRSSSGGGDRASPGAHCAAGAGAKVAGTGKKSFLFSDEEQKTLGNASLKAKRKSGMVPKAKTKIKVKKPGAGAKPKVATVFTDEAQPSIAKVCELFIVYGGERGDIAEGYAFACLVC